MASFATGPSLPLNINLEKIRDILIGGNYNLCTSNECRKAKIATIESGEFTISSDPEYKYGDEQALSVYKKCFPSSAKETASCRLCFYKLDDDEKKRKAMLKKPVNKRTGAKSKESHGKTFEGNINECISSYFQTPEENQEAVGKFEEAQGKYVRNLLEVFPEKQEISLPMFSNTFIPFLEHPNDPLDVSVHHFHDITIRFKRAITDKDRIDQQLYPIINTAMDLPLGYKNDAQEKLMSCMGNGINIKYFESKENDGVWYPKRMDMANYLTWWNDTRNNPDNKITVVELKQIYGDEFNREISFEILPFALMLGCWSEIKDTTTKLEYKCGQGCWIVKFQYNDEGKCPAVNMLWGDPEKYGMPVTEFKNLLFQLASVEKKIREEQQAIKNDWLDIWKWPPKDKIKVQTGTKKDGITPIFKTQRRTPTIPDGNYLDSVDEAILKLIFRWYGPATLEQGKINPLGMQAGSAFHNFVNYTEFQAKYIEWGSSIDKKTEIYYEGQTSSLTGIVDTIKNAIKRAGGLHTLGPKIFSYKGTEIIDGVKTRNKIQNKKIKEIFPRDCRAPQGNLSQTNIIEFLNGMRDIGEAIYIQKRDTLYKLFAPIQYNWIDKVTSKIYSLMELKKLYQAIIPSGGGVGDDELEDLLDIVLYDIPDDNTSEFVSVLDNLNKLEYSLQHKNISPDNEDELLLLDNVKLDIIDVNDRLENVEEEALIHNAFNKIIEICNKDLDNLEDSEKATLKEVLQKVVLFKNLLMDLIIELKNDFTGKTSIEGWEDFVAAEGDSDTTVVRGSALAHIVDFHMADGGFKDIYQAPKIGTKRSVSEGIKTGKKSPLPERIPAEIIEYEFTAYEKLERYLKNFQIYQEKGGDVLGFQYWQDVVDEIYDRYYQEKDDKDIEIERLQQQLDDYFEKLPSDSGSGGDTDNRSNDGRGSDDAGSSDKASSKSSDMSIGSDKTGNSAFSEFASLQQKGTAEKGAFDNVSDLSASLESSSDKSRPNAVSAKFSESDQSGHQKKKRGLKVNTDEEEYLRGLLHSKIDGMNHLQLNALNRHVSDGSSLREEMVINITPTNAAREGRLDRVESISEAMQPYGALSPPRIRKKSTSGDYTDETLFDEMDVEKVAARNLSEEEGVVEDMEIESQIKKKMKSWLGKMIIEVRPDDVYGPGYLNLHDEDSYQLFIKIYDALKLKAVETFGNNILKTPHEVDDPTVGKGIEKRLLIEKILFSGGKRKKKNRKKKKTRRKRKKKKKKTRTKK